MNLKKTKLLSPSYDLLRTASLFLDFDGTLVEIAARHDGVRVEERLSALMDTLQRRLDGRVAVISGRPAAEVQRMFGSPPFVIGGSHGLEVLWPDGRVSLRASRPAPYLADDEFSGLHLQFPAVVIERKPFGVALHYRLAPAAERACRECADRLAGRYGMIMQAGKMVFELRAPGADKGSAVEELMQSPPMSGGTPIFVGDDETDEVGFAVANLLGGAGVLVGPMRETHARYRLESVEHALRWLEQTCGAAT